LRQRARAANGDQLIQHRRSTVDSRGAQSPKLTTAQTLILDGMLDDKESSIVVRVRRGLAKPSRFGTGHVHLIL
jgi:hypothetical protein